MQVRDILTSEYNGCKFTVVNVGSVFLFTIVIKGNLHRGHIVITRSFVQRLLGQDYSKKQLDDITKYCVGMVQTTVENVLASGKSK